MTQEQKNAAEAMIRSKKRCVVVIPNTGAATVPASFAISGQSEVSASSISQNSMNSADM